MNNHIQEIIDFTQLLIQTRSQNSIDSESEVAHLVFEKLSQFAFEPKIIGPDKHPSVICQIKRGGSKTIWLESCLDTVTAGDKTKWEYPPFDGKIVGNKIYGRGAADSKTAIAIFCYLAKSLSEEKKFKGSIFLGFDADEQSGNFSGIKEVLKYAPKVDICILGYQGIDEISIGARGFLRLKLITLGKSTHTGSRSNKGINAIHNMAKAIERLSLLKIGGKKERFFEFGSSLNVSQINGGVAINIVPDRCEANIDIRLVPSQNKMEVLRTIINTMEKIKDKDSTFNYQLEEMQSEMAFLTNPDDIFVKKLQAIASKTLQKNIPLVASGQGSVGNVIGQKNIPIINAFGCESDNVHAPNEWVNIDTIPKVFEIYKEAIMEFCK